MKKLYLKTLLLSLTLTTISAYSWAQGLVELKVLDTYEALNREYDGGAAEIPAFDPGTNRVFVTNAQEDQIDVLEVKSDGTLMFVDSWDLAAAWADQGGPNSVAVYDGLVAVALENNDKQDLGRIYFFDTDGNLQGFSEVGALPDMVTFTPDGTKVLVANEGEPNDEYTNDPEGSVSIIDVSDFTVQTASFQSFIGSEDMLRARGIRIFGPNANAAQDFEPEYITTDGTTAWVVLQENNAVAVVDIANASVETIVPLGFKDHDQVGNRLDVSNRDNGIRILKWPVSGMYMPDAINSYVAEDGQTYLVTANEGDSRDYDEFSEEERVGDIDLDPKAFPNYRNLLKDKKLGRLKITTTLGDTDGDGDFDELYSYGARSFSIWSASGELVFDSGEEFERILANLLPDDFNSTNDESPSFDGRSDDKGPEPEGLAIGQIGDIIYAFIGLERIGGIMVYDITDPMDAQFVTYINNRNFDAVFDEDNTADFVNAQDLGPEGLVFIGKDDSPTGGNLLVVTNEISGTTTLYAVEEAGLSATIDDNLDQLTGISTTQIAPNPVVDILSIRIPNEGNNTVSIRMIDLNGRLLLDEITTQQTLEVNMTDFRAGFYLLSVQLPGKTVVKRIIKQ